MLVSGLLGVLGVGWSWAASGASLVDGTGFLYALNQETRGLSPQLQADLPAQRVPETPEKLPDRGSR